MRIIWINMSLHLSSCMPTADPDAAFAVQCRETSSSHHHLLFPMVKRAADMSSHPNIYAVNKHSHSAQTQTPHSDLHLECEWLLQHPLHQATWMSLLTVITIALDISASAAEPHSTDLWVFILNTSPERYLGGILTTQLQHLFDMTGLGMKQGGAFGVSPHLLLHPAPIVSGTTFTAQV